eukprot:TRINITY_DN28075_c0_g1_i1.p1 TRINITY_DN28075_c0_g1~~TRINITY_DN28075_c0_g1_i1.p1  ORF type:complete len:224 (+),score=34.79 TRINITY_DN28075_c0_g1_i1:61-672(+)
MCIRDSDENVILEEDEPATQMQTPKIPKIVTESSTKSSSETKDLRPFFASERSLKPKAQVHGRVQGQGSNRPENSETAIMKKPSRETSPMRQLDGLLHEVKRLQASSPINSTITGTINSTKDDNLTKQKWIPITKPDTPISNNGKGVSSAKKSTAATKLGFLAPGPSVETLKEKSLSLYIKRSDRLQSSLILNTRGSLNASKN